MKRVLFLAAILALTVLSVLMFKGHKAVESGTTSGSFMEDVRVVNRVSGEHRWTLKARRVEIPGFGKPARLTAVTIDFPEHEMQVESEGGYYDLKTHNLELTGNIRARTEDYVVRTESILVEPESGQISGPDKVVLEGEKFTIEGDGFQADGDRKVVLKNNVKAKFY